MFETIDITTIIAAIITSAASAFTASYVKNTVKVITSISNNISNAISVNNPPINISSPKLEFPPIKMNLDNTDNSRIVITSMQNIIINIFLVIYNIRIEESEFEIIKNCSIIDLYLDDNHKSVKDYCKVFCEQISSGSTCSVQNVLKNSLEHFTFLCRQYISEIYPMH